MSFLTREQAQQRSATLSVSRAHICVDLSGDDRTYTVCATYYLRSTSPTIMIDVDAQSVDKVLVDGVATDATCDGDHCFIDDVATNQPCKLTINATMRYSTNGQGLHRFYDDEDDTTYIYSHCEPADAHRAWPCFDQPDIKPLWQFTVTAPATWTVASNRIHMDITDGPHNTRIWEFGTTEPLSSYLTVLAAGDWHIETADTPWTMTVDDTDVRVPMRVLVRQSLAHYVDADRIFTLTAQGLSFYHQRYQCAYPWGKYDQIFCPEYNIGAMENPGLITFNENYIMRGTPTTVERQRFASTLLHEMCHMWFGDLVTMQWWDDLWLKESFADYESHCALTQATPFTHAWASIGMGRKSWAYEADGYRTTHPISADAPTVEAAQQNFDGISYAKGAAVLQQLSAWLGQDTYISGLRRYFQRYAFGTTTCDDFLTTVAADSPHDITTWATAWLKTSGIPTLSVTPGDNATTVTLTTPQHNPQHVVTIAAVGTQTQSSAVYRLNNSGDSITIEGDNLIVVNADDADYAIVRYPVDYLQRLMDSDISDPVMVSVIWQAAYQAVRSGDMPADRFITQALQVDAPATLRHELLLTIPDALKYLPRPHRDTVATTVATTLLSQDMSDATQRLTNCRVACDIAGLTTDPQGMCDLLDRVAPAIDNVDLRWRVLYARRAMGKDDNIEAFIKRFDSSATAPQKALTATYCAPGSWPKAFQIIDHLSAPDIRAVIAGLALCVDAKANMDAYVSALDTWWQTYPQHVASMVVKGMFPSGTCPECDQLRAWMDDDGHDDQLMRVVSECYDRESRYCHAQRQW